jgi:hypothetical protein
LATKAEIGLECFGRLNAPEGFNEDYDILQGAEKLNIVNL